MSVLSGTMSLEMNMEERAALDAALSFTMVELAAHRSPELAAVWVPRCEALRYRLRMAAVELLLAEVEA